MPISIDSPAYTGPRRLNEDVFQTAEEAVLVEELGNTVNTAALPPQSGPHAGDLHSSGRRGLPFTHAIGAHVAARPCQSALLAAAAGALAMLVIRSQVRRGRLQPWRAFRAR